MTRQASPRLSPSSRLLEDPFLGVADWLKALSDPTRLRILHSLRGGGEKCVGELLASCVCSQANVSRHLAVLREHRLVSCRRDGMRVFYRIADPAVFTVCETVCLSIAQSIPYPVSSASARTTGGTEVTDLREGNR